MKCRLYPNPAQAEAIDKAIYAVQLYLNMCTYNLFNHFDCTNEAVDEKTGEKVHWIKANLYDFVNADYKNRACEEDPRINDVPANALTTNTGAVLTDLKKRLLLAETKWERASKIKARQEGKKAKSRPKAADNVKSAKFKYPVESLIPTYYSRLHPRTSYTYAEAFSKLSFPENPHVMFATLNRIPGKLKIRGWNRKLRFGENAEMDFREFVQNSPKKTAITLCISKDNIGDYWITFKVKECWILSNVEAKQEVGCDVGIKDIVICSDGTKYPNKRFKHEAKKKMRALNRRLSRRQGWSNIKFREAHRKDTTIVPSRKYNATVKRMAVVQRFVQRRRDLWNNEITKDIVNRNAMIAVETLNVRGMSQNHHLAFALSDAGMGDILAKLNYKSAWHNRTLKAIDQWTPSSKRCNNCGYIFDGLTLAIREWTCPECGERHDRDINAAKNILYFAKKETEETKK